MGALSRGKWQKPHGALGHTHGSSLGPLWVHVPGNLERGQERGGAQGNRHSFKVLKSNSKSPSEGTVSSEWDGSGSLPQHGRQPGIVPSVSGSGLPTVATSLYCE